MNEMRFRELLMNTDKELSGDFSEEFVSEFSQMSREQFTELWDLVSRYHSTVVSEGL